VQSSDYKKYITPVKILFIGALFNIPAGFITGRSLEIIFSI
jgi:hypothetical protein